MSNKTLINPESPFKDEINDIKTLISGIKINYRAYISDILTFNLSEREKTEKDALRVTSIINYDFFSELYPKNNDKTYLKTYLHDRLLDVTANYFEAQGYNTFKERYLTAKVENKQIKGHADLILSGHILCEIKNYIEGTVNYDLLLTFIHQIMMYCKILNLKSAYLIIHNPKQFKKIVVFEIGLNNTVKYLDNYLKEILLIQDFKEQFKYK